MNPGGQSRTVTRGSTGTLALMQTPGAPLSLWALFGAVNANISCFTLAHPTLGSKGYDHHHGCVLEYNIDSGLRS